MDFGLTVFWPEATVRFLTNMQLFKMLIIVLSRVNYLWIIMFLSAVLTFTLTAPIHFRGFTGEQVMQC